jgi:hypothetical protein
MNVPVAELCPRFDIALGLDCGQRKWRWSWEGFGGWMRSAMGGMKPRAALGEGGLAMLAAVWTLGANRSQRRGGGRWEKVKWEAEAGREPEPRAAEEVEEAAVSWRCAICGRGIGRASCSFSPGQVTPFPGGGVFLGRLTDQSSKVAK